jgi:hypothetical protein
MPASKTSEAHTGRVALVTGTAHGIRQAIAASLAERGAEMPGGMPTCPAGISTARPAPEIPVRGGGRA